jgi:hypothetical protein
MGYLSAVDMIDQSKDRRAALQWHLSYNCYPPINPVFLDSAEQAIDAVLSEEGDLEIELPNGRVLTAYDICNQLHLDAFLAYSEWYEEEED